MKTSSKKVSLPESAMSRSDHDKTEEVLGRMNHVMSRWGITDTSTSCGQVGFGTIFWETYWWTQLLIRKKTRTLCCSPSMDVWKTPSCPLSSARVPCPNHRAGGLQGHDLPGAVLSAPAPAAQLACGWAGTIGVCMAASVTLRLDAIYVKLKR